jgi:hypothetical protein
MNQWIGKQVYVALSRGDILSHRLVEVGVVGAMFDDGGGGRLFIPWSSIHDLRLPAGDPDTAPTTP